MADVLDTSGLHGVHPYPCKFPATVAVDHLPPTGVVLDPFCGSGTTLVEAAVRGCDVIGFDCNPIAVLITKFKLLRADEAFVDEAERIAEALPALLASRATRTDDLPAFAGRDHWFGPVARRELGTIRQLLDEFEREGAIWLWLAVSVSSIVNRVSNQDAETRYARVDRDLRRGEVLEAFAARCGHVLRALRARPPLLGTVRDVVVHDTALGVPVESDSVDAVITSPPYANTMDYYLYHKQRMNVLGYDFKAAQRLEIGSRWEFSSLKAAPDKWQADYNRCIAEIGRVLKPTGRAIVVIGDSQIAGELISGVTVTEKAAADAGLAARLLESVALSGRSRSFNTRFQRPNKYEHVIELRP